MKYLVASDIHGSLFYTKKLENIIINENPDKIILLGDLFYHGPRNDLTLEYNPMEVSKILNKYSDKIICTRGNCDADVDEMICDFSMKEFYELEINGVEFFFSHGHKFNRNNIPLIGSVVVYGHEHIGYIEKENSIIFVNSGSVSLPRGNSVNSYLIIDDKLRLKDIDSNEIIIRDYLD